MMDSTVMMKPSLAQLRAELRHEKQKKEYSRTFRGTIFVLLVVAAISVLISSFFLTVLKVSGESMSPSLETGQIVVALNSDKFTPGEMIAFYYNNKVLVKRVVGSPGDWINIDEDGNVSVNGEPLDEPYLKVKAKYASSTSESEQIKFPYQVPESRYFVLGDNRDVSIDSRSTVVGCVSKEQLIGKLVYRVFPFKEISKLN
ncbi:MAG: signal peptidase I [Lachnospiraceae bacterium]|nr:signal peptidase I [Lachnospiraceae bacterium]